MQVQSQALANTIFQVTDALVLVLDREGRIRNMNPACERLTGYSSQELEGRPVFETLVPEDERDELRAYWNRLWTGTTETRHTNHIVTRDGERRCVSWSNATVQGEDSEQYVVATGVDITEKRQLERDVVQASEDERSRIGRELHDSVASDLIAAAISFENLHRRVDAGLSDTSDILRRVKNVEESVRQCATQTRSLSHLLASGQITPSDFPAALSDLLHTREQLSDVPCRLQIPEEGVPSVLDASTTEHLYRIAQEAVHNATKHGDPDQIEVRLVVADPSQEEEAAESEEGPRHLVLQVRDDGRGLPDEVHVQLTADSADHPGPSPDEESAGGIGLHLMQYRADLIGANLRIESADRGGTVVRCTVPLPETTKLA